MSESISWFVAQQARNSIVCSYFGDTVFDLCHIDIEIHCHDRLFKGQAVNSYHLNETILCYIVICTIPSAVQLNCHSGKFQVFTGLS